MNIERNNQSAQKPWVKRADLCREFSDVFEGMEKEIDELETVMSKTFADLTYCDYRMDFLEKRIEHAEIILTSSITVETAERIEENIRQDYEQCIAFLKSLKMDESDKVLKASLDRMQNEDEFLPSIGKVLGALKLNEMRLYQEMEKAGLNPKLQITPIFFTDADLAKLFWARIKGGVLRGDRSEEDRNVPRLSAVSYKILESDDPDKVYLRAKRPKSKQQLIDECLGFLVEIAPTVIEVKGQKRKNISNADALEFAVNYYNESIKKGYNFLNYNSCLTNMANIKYYGGEEAKPIFDLKAPKKEVLVRLLLDEDLPNASQHAYAGIDSEGVLLSAGSNSELTDEWNEDTLSQCRTIRLDWASKKDPA